MKMYLISDNIDTLTGMRLTGIDGIIVHKEDEVRQALDKVVNDKEIAIVLITEKLADLVPDLINEIKISHSLPLITVIPDRHGTTRPADSITKYVKESIGIKI